MASRDKKRKNRRGSPAPAARRPSRKRVATPPRKKLGRRRATGAKRSKVSKKRAPAKKTRVRSKRRTKPPRGKAPRKTAAKPSRKAPRIPRGGSSSKRDAARRAANARKANKFRRHYTAKRAAKTKALQAGKKPTNFQVRIKFATFAQIKAGKKPPTPERVAREMRRALKLVAEQMRKVDPKAVQNGYFALGLERAISRGTTGSKWEMEASPVWTGASRYMQALANDAPELLANDNMGAAKPYRVAILAVIADGFIREGL